jgi:hypothetical protein
MDYSVFNAIRKSGLSSTQRWILTVLADYTDKDGGAYPAHATIARETGFTERGVRKCLEEMSGSGVLTIIRGKPNRYQINPEKFPKPEPGSSFIRNQVPHLNGNIRNHVPDPTPKPEPGSSSRAEAIRNHVPAIRNHVPENEEPGSSNTPSEAPKEAGATNTDSGLPPPAEVPKPKKLSQRLQEILAECEATSMHPILPSLDVPPFREAWESWCKWRTYAAMYGTPKGKKPRWTVNAAKRCLTKMAKMGPPRAVAAIENSLDRWEDVYEPSPDDLPFMNGRNGHHNGHAYKSPDGSNGWTLSAPHDNSQSTDAPI